jgi:hypothetical protein
MNISKEIYDSVFRVRAFYFYGFTFNMSDDSYLMPDPYRFSQYIQASFWPYCCHVALS